jgi:hypothetical protein
MYVKAVLDHLILARRMAWPAVLVREARGGPHESLLMASDWGGEFVRTNATKTKCIKETGNSILPAFTQDPSCTFGQITPRG